MKLQEILDKIYQWKREDASSTHEIAHFKTDDKSNVRVYMTLEYTGDYSLSVITFTRDFSQGLTGQGDAFKIFSTVTDIIKNFIGRKKPDVIVYTADKDEPSRVSLYNKMTNKFKPGGYTRIHDVDAIGTKTLRDDLKSWLKEQDSDVSIVLLAKTELCNPDLS